MFLKVCNLKVLRELYLSDRCVSLIPVCRWQSNKWQSLNLETIVYFFYSLSLCVIPHFSYFQAVIIRKGHIFTCTVTNCHMTTCCVQNIYYSFQWQIFRHWRKVKIQNVSGNAVEKWPCLGWCQHSFSLSSHFFQNCLSFSKHLSHLCIPRFS